MKCLLVDDDKAVLEQAEIFLEKEEKGLELDTVCRPVKALDLLEEYDYDAIISDYNMPEMNGSEFLEQVRNKKDLDTPFIFYTGESQEETNVEEIKDEYDKYIQKRTFSKGNYRSLAENILEAVEKTE